MFRSLGYSKELLENFSITDNLLTLGDGAGCDKPSCSLRCVNCELGCNQGSDGGGSEEPV